MAMNPRGYLTQCDSGGHAYWNRCGATTRLTKPAAWRCEECERKHGKLEAKR